MDLTQIRYFLALSQTLNFTRAAEQCHVTQPALTKSIQRLEAELGGPLLLRERALTQLTALGQSMLPLLEQAYAAAERAKAHASGLRRRQESPLRAGFATDIAAAPFIPLFAELAARLPGFALTVAAGTSAVLSEALLQGTLDVALMASPLDLPERMNRWALFDEPAFLSMRDDNPAATACVHPIQALHGQAVVLHRQGCMLSRLLSNAPHIQPSVRHWAETAEHVATLVKSGLGAASLPLGSETAPGLVRRPVAGAPASEAMLVVVAGRPTTPAADLFVKMARARDWRNAVTAR